MLSPFTPARALLLPAPPGAATAALLAHRDQFSLLTLHRFELPCLVAPFASSYQGTHLEFSDDLPPLLRLKH